FLLLSHRVFSPNIPPYRAACATRSTPLSNRLESFDSLSDSVLLVFINGFPKPEPYSS
ncbi:hypothetical protein TorRG33x02_286670, partial [Trema orientale]